MRLNERQHSLILQQAIKHFGNTSRVWLFGSRVDDQQKGGDIDLYIETKIQDPVKVVDAKLGFLVEIHRLLGEQKIDIVLQRQGFVNERAICQIAKETGVRIH